MRDEMSAPTIKNLKTITVNDLAVDLIDAGAGQPVLFLHPEIGIDPHMPVLESLAHQVRLLAPSHPGFGRTAVAPHMTSVDDLAYFYLDLLKVLDLRDVTVVGVSLGAWIAAEIAVKSTERLRSLVLANPVGIKVSDRETRDIVDIFALTDEDYRNLAYSDVAAAARDYSVLTDDERLRIARNRDATARFCWSPYMHNPKLKSRLYRIDVPTLVLWGADDRLAAGDYGRAFAELIPDARFHLIEKAGHFPHVEQPAKFAGEVFAFVTN